MKIVREIIDLCRITRRETKSETNNINTSTLEFIVENLSGKTTRAYGLQNNFIMSGCIKCLIMVLYSQSWTILLSFCLSCNLWTVVQGQNLF